MLKKRNKKSQITIFIILGILIVLATAFVIYLYEQEIIFRPKPPVLPEETTPIKAFVESCIESLGTEGANLAGTTGGYIYIPDEIANNPGASIKISPMENGKIPYWFFEGENRIPPLEFIEEQISRYINENLKECILGLEPFQNQYNITELGDIETETQATDNGIIFNVKYPIEVTDKLGRKTTKIDHFNADIDYRLKRAYELAVKIMNTENSQAKLEDLTVDLLALDTDIPYNNFEFSCKKREWKIKDIENKLKLLLRSDIPLIRIDKTDYRPVPAAQTYVLNHYIWDVSAESYQDMKVSFTYDDSWPLNMYVRPNKGSYIESGMQKGMDLASWLCMQIWKFTYDVVYPVTATIYDEKSDYSFTFAFDVLVDHNKANREAFPTSSFEFETRPRQEDYCKRRVNEISVFTYENVSDDYESHLEIDDVNISFTCLKYTCNIGKSEYSGSAAVLTEKFPYCVWGILRGKKQGYKTAETFIATDKEGEAELYLTPVKMIDDYTVIKHKLTYDGDAVNVDETGEELKDGETATITIKRKNQQSTGFYPKDEPINLEFLSYGNFEYEVEIYLLDGDNIIGGYIGNWTPEWEELNNGREIKFNAVYMDSFKDEEEEFAFLSGLKEYSKEVPKPEII